MTGYEFEHYCADYLKEKGFQIVEITPSSGDNGADIIARKDGIRYAFQCKYYSANVGNNAVQEVYAAKDYYKCNKAVVITNSGFTTSAIDTAKRLSVELWPNIPIKSSKEQPVPIPVEAKWNNKPQSIYKSDKRSVSKKSPGCFTYVFLLILFLLAAIFIMAFLSVLQDGINNESNKDKIKVPEIQIIAIEIY